MEWTINLTGQAGPCSRVCLCWQQAQDRAAFWRMPGVPVVRSSRDSVPFSHQTGKTTPQTSLNVTASKAEKLATVMLHKIFQQWGQTQIVDKVVSLYHFVISISYFDFSLSSKHGRYSAGISKSICYTLRGREQKEFLIVSQGSREELDKNLLCCDHSVCKAVFEKGIILFCMTRQWIYFGGAGEWEAQVNCISHRWRH